MRFLTAFGLTLFAGLATGIGGALAFFTKKTNTKFLAVSLGFSAGVMIYISLVEIFQDAKVTLTSALGNTAGYWAVLGGFFGGILLIALIDKIIPKSENPHEMIKIEDINMHSSELGKHRLMRAGLFTALAVTIHNFPEGLAAFMSAYQDPKLGIAIAIAIAIHNIPEGIAVSVPIYFATGNRKKAFFYSVLSGISEPLGALVGFGLLLPFMNDVVFGIIFAAIAGIMVFISVDELLPSAREYGESHLSIYGMIAGMAVMAVSLVLLA